MLSKLIPSKKALFSNKKYLELLSKQKKIEQLSLWSCENIIMISCWSWVTNEIIIIFYKINVTLIMNYLSYQYLRFKL